MGFVKGSDSGTVLGMPLQYCQSPLPLVLPDAHHPDHQRDVVGQAESSGPPFQRLRILRPRIQEFVYELELQPVLRVLEGPFKEQRRTEDQGASLQHCKPVLADVAGNDQRGQVLVAGDRGHHGVVPAVDRERHGQRPRGGEFRGA